MLHDTVAKMQLIGHRCCKPELEDPWPEGNRDQLSPMKWPKNLKPMKPNPLEMTIQVTKTGILMMAITRAITMLLITKATTSLTIVILSSSSLLAGCCYYSYWTSCEHCGNNHTGKGRNMNHTNTTGSNTRSNNERNSYKL